MSTTLQYAGVNFGFLKTHALTQRPQYDPSGADRIFTWNTLEVESLMYIVPGAEPLSDLGDTIAEIKSAISKDRQPLLYTVNGVPVLSSTGTDEASGPKPKLVTFDRIVDCAYRIVWFVEVVVNECQTNTTAIGPSGGGDPAQQAIASLRWEQSQEIDVGTGYSTIITTGLLIGRRNILQALSLGIDDLRQYIKPPLMNGFTRSGKYTIQPDGLRIAFTLTDTQKLLQPPSPFVSWDGRFIQTVQKHAQWFSRVQLTVRYRLETDRQLAIALALSIAINRLVQTPVGNLPACTPALQGGVIEESMTEPVVTVVLESRTNAPEQSALVSAGQSVGGSNKIDAQGKAIVKNTVALGQGLGTTPDVISAQSGYIDLTAGANGGGGTAMLDGLRLFTQTLQDECTSANAAQILQGLSTFEQVSGWDGLGNWPYIPPVASGSGSVPALPEGGTLAPNPLPGYEPNIVLDDQGNPLITAPVFFTGTPSADPSAAAEYVALDELVGGNPSADPSLAMILANTGGTLQNVTIGYLTDSSLGNNFVVGNQTPGIWTNYYCEYEWIRPGGRYILPSTVPGVPATFGQTYTPYYILHCSYNCEREGGPPEVPSPMDYPNFALLDSSQVKPNVNRAADGQSVVYKTAGRIQWLWLGSDNPTLYYPIPPWCSIDYTMFPDLVYDADENLEAAT